MKGFKVIVLGLSFFLISFLISFAGLEAYKNTGNAPALRESTYDLVIKNARIIDGTGEEIIRADIGISDNKISKISKSLYTNQTKIFDATGFTVAPNKVDWPEDLDWVKRDLSSALMRYPMDRIIIAKAKDLSWQGKSVQVILKDGIFSKNNLAQDLTAVAWIVPQGDIKVSSDIEQAYYLLSGWRGEVLGKNVGKVKEGFIADLVVFNHREIDDGQILTYLQAEELPPIEFIIKGSEIQSTKTDS